MIPAWLCMCALASTASGETLLKTQFGNTGKQTTAGTVERIRGTLPEGWRDNSEWARVWVTYESAEEQGLMYHRVNVTQVEEGWAQFAYSSLPNVTGENVYRLSLKLRNLMGNPVQVGIRQQGAPYDFLWQVNEPFTKDWGTYDYEFRLPRNEQPIGVWILLQGTGMLDIATFSLAHFSREDLIEEVKQLHLDGGPANLYRNTRFPLGLQNGWAIGRSNSDGDEATVEAEQSIIGPSGAPPLHVVSQEHVQFITEPFGIVYPIVEHALCVSVRGSGEWRFTVASGHQNFGSASATLAEGQEWQRLRLVFTPEMGIDSYVLQVGGSGVLLMDALQAGPSDKCEQYQTAFPYEVALALPTSDASSARIQFDDESASVRYCASGPGRAILKSRLINVYGEARSLPDVQLSGDGFLAYGTFGVNAFPEKPYGALRLETWVEQDEQRVSPINELVFYRLRRPRYWGQDAPHSPFGVHTLSTTRHNIMAKAVGINWVRLHDAGFEYIGWWNLEPERDQWRFFDRELKRYRDHHLHILGELGSAPSWASYYQDTGRTEFGYFDKYFQPKSLAEFANYVRVVTERYRGVIDYWDVWNEPWIHAWWGVAYDHDAGGRAGYITSEEPQRDFAVLTRVARDAALFANPSAKILGFNSTTGGGGSQSIAGDEWTQGVLDHQGLDHCDVVCYHAYTGGPVGFPGDTVEAGLAIAVGPIREALGDLPKPVWMTEGSSVTHLMNNGLYLHTLPYRSKDSVIHSSDRLARYLLSLLANGVEKLFLYSMHSHNSFYTPEPRQWGVLTTDEGYLHPCGAAHSAFAWHIEGTSFVKRIDLNEEVFAYLFQGEQRSVAVISGRPGSEPLAISHAEGITATDLFGNPLLGDATFGGTLTYLSSDGGMGAIEEVLGEMSGQ